MNKLPPLNPLRAFEAAGRLQSIRRASEELSVTPGAVSRQVQSLEGFLGVRLFRRQAGEIGLTVEGEQYLAAINQHLDGIRDATEKLTGRRTAEIIRVSAHTTFALKWLIPRFGSFHAENKKAEVRLTTSNEPVDFIRESVHGAIRLGDGLWAGVEVDRLITNELIPFCSPAFRKAHDLKTVHDLAGLPLLHSMAHPDDWRNWLAASGARGVDPYAGDKYSSTILAYKAAVEGLGIMLGTRVLFSEDLRTKRLVEPFEFVLDREAFTYYFIYPRDRLRNPTFRRFRSWLLEQARIQVSSAGTPRLAIRDNEMAVLEP